MTLRPSATAESPEASASLARSLGAASKDDPNLEWLQTMNEFAELRRQLEDIRSIMRRTSGVGAMRLVKAYVLALYSSSLVDKPFQDACDALMEEIALYGFTDEAHRLFIRLYQEYRRLWHEARLAHRERQ